MAGQRCKRCGLLTEPEDIMHPRNGSHLYPETCILRLGRAAARLYERVEALEQGLDI